MVDVCKYCRFDSVVEKYDVITMMYLSDECNKDGNDPLCSSQWSFLLNKRRRRKIVSEENLCSDGCYIEFLSLSCLSVNDLSCFLEFVQYDDSDKNVGSHCSFACVCARSHNSFSLVLPEKYLMKKIRMEIAENERREKNSSSNLPRLGNEHILHAHTLKKRGRVCCLLVRVALSLS